MKDRKEEEWQKQIKEWEQRIQQGIEHGIYQGMKGNINLDDPLEKGLAQVFDNVNQLLESLFSAIDMNKESKDKIRNALQEAVENQLKKG